MPSKPKKSPRKKSLQIFADDVTEFFDTFSPRRPCSKRQIDTFYGAIERKKSIPYAKGLCILLQAIVDVGIAEGFYGLPTSRSTFYNHQVNKYNEYFP